MAFEFSQTDIPGVILVKPNISTDIRGLFSETYKYSIFAAHGIPDQFLQDNYSRSVKGVLRGLHYQLPPFGQAKLIRCLAGEIFDVAVDIRRNSVTFGKWTAVVLSADNRKMLYIPEGFAHGFCILSEFAEVAYKVTMEYAPDCDRGIRWNDPEMAISWPTENPVVSEKDRCLPLLSDADIFG
ncbi:MAG: dTDP-4-dehydrorhamnose 3,5-epimerase [Candidatus Omnitrophica bacterium]|nr:dTDP-4-dehydrorhamnose 3,5-epimerase [Candidatus Omnitrophota bacterium]